MMVQLGEKELNHILLWMPNWIGDVILVLPAIQGLRKKFPEARITALVRPPSHEILSLHPSIDTVIKFPFSREGGFLDQVSFARRLRKYQFDLGIVFPNSFRSALLASLSGARIRVGYNTDYRAMFLTDPLEMPSDAKKGHGMDYYINLVTPLGVENAEKKLLPLVYPENKIPGDEIFSRFGINREDRVICVSPGASKPAKRWHVSRFGILCQKLVKDHNVKIILLGSAGESDILEEIAKYAPRKNIFPLPGRNLKLVAGLISRCHLFIGNDSGLMHLAAWTRTPLVGIFGPGSPVTTGPCAGSEKVEIVTRNYARSPCRHNFFRECKPSPHNKPYCIEDISVAEVSEAAERLLRKILL